MNTVYFDIDTQLDFVSPAGALYVPGAERIMPTVARLNQLAASRSIPVVSTTDAHSETDLEFKTWPPHCISGTIGQTKPAATLLPNPAVIPSAPGHGPVSGARQIILQKQVLDCFSNPNLPTILEQLRADHYVVYGVVTEYCVRCAAMGLLATGKPVTLVLDAVKSLSETDERNTLAEFRAAGGQTTLSAEL